MMNLLHVYRVYTAGVTVIIQMCFGEHLTGYGLQTMQRYKDRSN